MLGFRDPINSCVLHIFTEHLQGLWQSSYSGKEGSGGWSYIGYYTGMSRIWLLWLREGTQFKMSREELEGLQLLVKQFCLTLKLLWPMLHLSAWGALTLCLAEPAEEAVKCASDSDFRLTAYEFGGQEQLRRGLGEAESQSHCKTGLFKDWSQISQLLCVTCSSLFCFRSWRPSSSRLRRISSGFRDLFL